MSCPSAVSFSHTSSDPDLFSSIINSWATLIKRRPALLEFVVHTLIQWTPAKFEGTSASVVRSVEKSVRILLTHISRYVIACLAELHTFECVSERLKASRIMARSRQRL